MRKLRFTDIQILVLMAIPKQVQGNIPLPDLCREHGKSVPHFTHDAHSSASMMVRLQELEDENRGLKKSPIGCCA